MGDYDVQVVLAARHNWTPEQIAGMDSDFIEEELARIRAENDVERARQRRAKRKQNSGDEGEDADVSEIE